MALINPSNLYSGGQGILRDDFVNFVANQQAKRRAIDEASNQYFDKALRDINPAGVRVNDQPYITQKIAGLQSYWLQNKDAIKKGGLAQQDFLRKVNETKLDIDLSKSRGELLKTIGDARFKGVFKPREKDLNIIDAVNMPINDPRSKRADGMEYGLTDFSVSAKPWTPKDEMNLVKAAFGKHQPSYDPNAPEIKIGSTGQVLVTQRFKPESIKAIGEAAAEMIRGNESAEIHYEGLLEQPESVEKATNALRKVYGEKLPDGTPLLADTPIKMAQGLMLDKAFNTVIEKPSKDIEEERRFKQRMQGQRLDAAMSRLRVSERGKTSRLKTMMEGLEVDDVVNNAASRGVDVSVPGRGVLKAVPLSNLDPLEVEDMLGEKDEYGQYPVEPYLSPNGNEYIIIDEKNNRVEAKGGIIDKNRVLNNTFNRTKGFLKSRFKQEVKLPSGTQDKQQTTTPQASSKKETLAERMRRLKKG